MKPKHYTIAAYYFPNWHRKPGSLAREFGEWPVLRAAPKRFPGHEQPKVSLWGYEDEADPRVMAKKIDAAADHGIGVFLFDWYFNRNGTFLERALNEGYLRATNKYRVKFALMWANHNLKTAPGAVSRKTFGKLVEHVVADYMMQPSYWRIEDRAYFSIYEIDTFLDGIGGIDGARKAFARFNAAAQSAGLAGVHLDIVDWQLARHKDAPQLLKALQVDSVTPYVWCHLVKLKDFPATDYRYMQARYFQHCKKAAARYGVPYFPNVTMGWDSTPRIPKGQPHANTRYPDTPVIKNNTPAHFSRALRKAKAFLDRQPPESRIATIYAWNEWTEGGYLEPDTVHRYAYLQAIKQVFQ